MSLKKNTIANYIGLAYTILIGILMLPVYLHYMGSEAFGLIGFFTLLQSWLGLLTMGMSPALARQVAHARGSGEIGGKDFRQLLRSLEIILLIIGTLTALAIWAADDLIAQHWLNVGTLPISDVAYCVALMGMMVGIRWVASLYQGGIRGLELQTWLNAFNVGVATVRFVAVYGLIRWVTQDPKHFFEFQLAVSILELAMIALKFYASLPATPGSDPGLAFSWQPVRKIAPFAGGIAYTSMLWVFMTQTDKLIFSHQLSLAEYGYLSLVAAIANGILQFAEPINQATLPRMTQLFAAGKEMQMLDLYRKTSQYMAVVVSSAAGVVALFSEQLIYALTEKWGAAEWGAPILTWYALGNGLLVMVGMQYVLQYVHGRVQMHVINTTINAAIQVPILAYVAVQHGVLAVAVTWFGIRLVTFFIWPAIVHRKFAPTLQRKWLFLDIGLPIAAVFAMLTGFRLVVERQIQLLDSSPREIIMVLGIAGVLALLAGAMAAPDMRADLKRIFVRVRNAAH